MKDFFSGTINEKEIPFDTDDNQQTGQKYIRK